MKKLIFLLLLLLSLLAVGQSAFATEEIALETGQDCSYCHLAPSGGGELTPAGESYLANQQATGEIQSLSTGSKIFRFIAGYLHIVFSVLWFGTILYVHIVLKPSYAEKGLPRGEKFVGVLSFWVVGISGAILTSYRIDSWNSLFDTRFGTLLAIKIGLYLTMLFSAILVIKIIGPRLAAKETKKHIPGAPFNQSTLQTFNGQDGQPCYFAYQGKVYDASDSKLWPGGEHMRRHSSGKELTADLSMAPHDEKVMERLPVVGDYAEDAATPAAPSAKAFYFIAYMNLIIVFLILLIIALWKWG